MSYTLIPAKSVSYGGTRALTAVKYIVIHYTGNNNDTAKGNCNYFKNGNTRSAGAHFFVSQNGEVCQSIDMKKIAYGVGGFVTQKNGAGSYYKKCTNTNSVSIELCDNASKDPSEAQTKAVKELIAYIQSYCIYAKTIIRHWDVSGKSCPARMTGSNNVKWNAFKAAVTGGKVANTATETTVKENKPAAAAPQPAVDGIIGKETIRIWQKVCGTPIDGVISGQLSSLKKYHLNIKSIKYGDNGGSSLIKKVQELLKIDTDGQLGPNTIKAIQKHLHCKEDGYLGVETAKAIQKQLSYNVF